MNVIEDVNAGIRCTLRTHLVNAAPGSTFQLTRIANAGLDCEGVMMIGTIAALFVHCSNFLSTVLRCAKSCSKMLQETACKLDAMRRCAS
jgi:hypothetical protein